MAKEQILPHPRSAQVKIAIPEAKILIHFAIFVYIEWWRLRWIKYLCLSSNNLNLTSSQFEVLRSRRTGGNLSTDSDHIFTAHLVGYLVALGGGFGIDYHLDNAIARSEKLHQQYLKAEVNFLPIARQYERISDLIAQSESEERMWRENLTRVQMALQAEQNGTRTHLKMVKAAAPIYRPSWPALWHVFSLALGGGLGFGALLAILMTRWSRTFASGTEAKETLGLPLLGTVGPILSPAAQRLLAIRRYVLAPAAVCLLVLVTLLAATGVVMSMNYPGKYAYIMEQVTPTARAVWQGMQNLLGLI